MSNLWFPQAHTISIRNECSLTSKTGFSLRGAAGLPNGIPSGEGAYADSERGFIGHFAILDSGVIEQYFSTDADLPVYVHTSARTGRVCGEPVNSEYVHNIVCYISIADDPNWNLWLPTPAAWESIVLLMRWLYGSAYGWGAARYKQNFWAPSAKIGELLSERAGDLAWQCPIRNADRMVTRDYVAYFSPGVYYHTGIDIAGVPPWASGAVPVYPAAGGLWGNAALVTEVGSASDTGNYVVLRHHQEWDTKPPLETAYYHLHDIWVNKGDWVDINAPIGSVGSTGATSTGVHLHFSVFDGAFHTSGTPYAPYQYRTNPFSYLTC